MAEKREVFGFPVNGDLNVYGSNFVKQRDGRELVAEMVKLFEMGVDHITWTQYTPHFNDGEPCTFSANDIQVYAQAEYDEPLTRKVLEREYKNRRWDYELRKYVDDGYNEVEVDREYEVGYDFEPSSSDKWPHPEFLPESPVMEQAFKVNNMITGGAFDQFLGSNFGDGCQVTFNGREFTFDDYRHD